MYKEIFVSICEHTQNIIFTSLFINQREVGFLKTREKKISIKIQLERGDLMIMRMKNALAKDFEMN